MKLSRITRRVKTAESVVASAGAAEVTDKLENGIDLKRLMLRTFKGMDVTFSAGDFVEPELQCNFWITSARYYSKKLLSKLVSDIGPVKRMNQRNYPEGFIFVRAGHIKIGIVGSEYQDIGDYDSEGDDYDKISVKRENAWRDEKGLDPIDNIEEMSAFKEFAAAVELAMDGDGDGGDDEGMTKKSKRNIRTLRIFADGEAMKLAQKLYFQYISQSDAGGFLTFVTDLDGLMVEHREDSKDPINLEPEEDDGEEEEKIGVDDNDGDDDSEGDGENDEADESTMRKILKRIKKRKMLRKRERDE
jgi:hypothetical protein